MLIRIVLITAALAGAAQFAPGQQSPAVPGADIPNYILYDSLFYRVTWLDGLADKLAKEGKADFAIRSTIRRELGLTPREETALKEIARRWRATNEGILASARAVVAAKGRAASSSPEVQGLMQQRAQTVLEHISQLQTSFGAVRFQQIDAAVRRTSRIQAGTDVRPAAKGGRVRGDNNEEEGYESL